MFRSQFRELAAGRLAAGGGFSLYNSHPLPRPDELAWEATANPLRLYLKWDTIEL